jgi:death-on-curing protein
MPPKYPTIAEVLFLHQMLLDRFGGSDGVRDLGLLDSALARPQSGYYTSLAEEAAALIQSLCQNHAFVDGNKRVAFATTAVFLRMNGYRLVANADEAERFVVDDIIRDRAPLEAITAWIGAHLRKNN